VNADPEIPTAVIASERCADVHPDYQHVGSRVSAPCHSCRSWGAHVAAAILAATDATAMEVCGRCEDGCIHGTTTPCPHCRGRLLVPTAATDARTEADGLTKAERDHIIDTSPSEPPTRPTLAKSYSLDPRRGVLIDGDPLPWYTAAKESDGSPLALIEPHDDVTHILWLPVLIDGPVPDHGRPDGHEPEACACVAYTIRTDYGTGVEHDVDRSSCPIHRGADDA
jgi:hypothetical protein